MPFLNQPSVEASFKVIYWGPSGGGKTHHLQWLAEHAPACATGKLVQLAAETEQTLFFEFLPLSLGDIGALGTQFHLYAVPGQGGQAAVRQTLLHGADAMVFVADARPARQDANAAALAELHTALAYQGRALASLPHVFACGWLDEAGAPMGEVVRRRLDVAPKAWFDAGVAAPQGIRRALLQVACAALEAHGPTLARQAGVTTADRLPGR